MITLNCRILITRTQNQNKVPLIDPYGSLKKDPQIRYPYFSDTPKAPAKCEPSSRTIEVEDSHIRGQLERARTVLGGSWVVINGF